MKKATLISFLFTGFIGISQSIVWNNPIAAVTPGQTITLDVSYDSGSEDFFYVGVLLREVDASFNIVKDYNQIFPINESGGQQPNSQSNVTFNYTVDDTAPNSSALPTGNQYLMIVFMSYNNDGGFVNDNMPVTVDSTLSIGDFDTKENFTAFYPNPVKDIIHFNDNVVSKEYRIIDITGRIIKSINAQKTINVEELTTGSYFIETEKGIGKFFKI
ncbi:T9SS type A sorting domain-containing protein [uncultured Aquimarina sp.]|uniref:T9SS type A sorting domain-containing protein n=1 Tax=uncultured Aquimarina sp. TaxID=575652 RepID=UPI00262E55FE|nr:T9SS type A sorting domain-containing protein [uncultured Aquimarina sp.]